MRRLPGPVAATFTSRRALLPRTKMVASAGTLSFNRVPLPVGGVVPWPWAQPVAAHLEPCDSGQGTPRRQHPGRLSCAQAALRAVRGTFECRQVVRAAAASLAPSSLRLGRTRAASLVAVFPSRRVVLPVVRVEMLWCSPRLARCRDLSPSPVALLRMGSPEASLSLLATRAKRLQATSWLRRGSAAVTKGERAPAFEVALPYSLDQLVDILSLPAGILTRGAAATSVSSAALLGLMRCLVLRNSRRHLAAPVGTFVCKAGMPPRAPQAPLL